MPEPTIRECHWLITHLGHPAWFQRAALIGDFAPGRVPIVNYASTLEGAEMGPELERPVCGTCSAVPMTDELDIVERTTRRSDFLAHYRKQGRWPPPSDPDSCWYCNSPGQMFHFSRLAYASQDSEKVRLCDACDAKVGAA